MQLPEDITSRFETVRELGHGGQGATFLGRDKASGAEVVIKSLDFQALGSWKDFELFQREISILKSLDHPAIPSLVAHHPDDLQDSEELVLVYEYEEGEALGELLENDAVFTEEEAKEFLGEMLEVLSYLHGLNPAVVHRDIKPSNIVKRRDGTYALIDFGAAQSTQGFTGGSTFVGTNGYMAPEQLMGRAEPRSDLYSLGATVLHLMTGIHPTNFQRDNHGFQIDLSISPSLREFILMLTAPTPERRFESASQALEALSSNSTALTVSAPSGLRVSRDHFGTLMKLPAPKSEAIGGSFSIGIQGVFAYFDGDLKFGIAAIVVAILVFIWFAFVQRRVHIEDGGAWASTGFGPLKKTRKWAHEDVAAVQHIKGKTKYQSFVLVQFVNGSQVRIGRGLGEPKLRHINKSLRAHHRIKS